MFMKDGLDGQKNARQIQRCHENVLIQSFQKMPHLMGLADYPYIPFMATSGSGLDEAGHKRDIGVVGQTHQMGAFFEALNEHILMAP